MFIYLVLYSLESRRVYFIMIILVCTGLSVLSSVRCGESPASGSHQSSSDTVSRAAADTLIKSADQREDTLSWCDGPPESVIGTIS